MKRTTLSALTLVALMIAGAAQAETYLKGEIGGGFSDSYDIGSGKADLDNAWLFGGAVGASLSPHTRLEGELLYSKADLQGGGTAKATVGFANGYYDFGDGTQITPFVGAGLGYGKFDTSAGNDNSWAYQLTAGASKTLSPGLTAELAYRYLKAPDLQLSGLDASYKTSAITAGLRWKFGS